MIQLKIYKNTGEIKFVELDSKSDFTFSDSGKDDSGPYFSANADTVLNAFHIMELGLRALQDSLRGTISTLESLIGNIKLQSKVVELQLDKKPEKLVE